MWAGSLGNSHQEGCEAGLPCMRFNRQEDLLVPGSQQG